MKQILMVRHGILKIVIFYLRYLSRGTPYNLLSNAPLFIQKPFKILDTNSDGASRHFRDSNLVFNTYEAALNHPQPRRLGLWKQSPSARAQLRRIFIKKWYDTPESYCNKVSIDKN
ncbi:MAG: hypothetical protein AAF915_21815 [Cyanobacteria bacterium P01_D01_bin.50]